MITGFIERLVEEAVEKRIRGIEHKRLMLETLDADFDIEGQDVMLIYRGDDGISTLVTLPGKVKGAITTLSFKCSAECHKDLLERFHKKCLDRMSTESEPEPEPEPEPESEQS